ncbi:MAG TPA: TIGR00725 family protein [Candidatus Altiarchaeales archaeon]|nr:MAG: TIGR00725 family protein [Candidatus Altiarchaeales archaeon]HDN83754.1 TIGR00725 family protein [Candidatus Altiarchaeales archaeon]
MKILIGVIGADIELDDDLKAICEEIGKGIASRGWVVVCGGKGGVMKHVCKAAKEANGLTIGILPSLSKEEANEYVDIAIPTGFGVARNVLVVSSADVVIAINGRIGTLSEIALALNYGKDVILVEDSKGIAKEIYDDLVAIGFKDKVHLCHHHEAINKVSEILGIK